MKKPELYQKTVDILVKAYFNDTLVHGNCRACAVGNIICGRLGSEMDNGCFEYPHQPTYIVNGERFSVPYLSYKAGGGVLLDASDVTGYSNSQLCLIENAFEGTNQEDSKEERMFNGLMAVIDVLDEIHENNDAAATDAAKKRFQKNFS